MGILRNLSIKTKLLASFMIIAALIAVTGLFGKFGMWNIEKGSNNIYSNNLQGIDNLHLIKESLLDELSSVQGAIIDNDAAKTKEAVQIIDEDQESIKKYVEEYKKIDMTEDSKKTFNDFTSLLEKYNNTRKSVTDSLSNGNYSEAIKNRENMFVDRDNMFKKLNELIEANQSAAKQVNEKNAEDYRITVNIMHAILAVGIVLAVAIGLIISLYISNTVKKY